MKFAICNELFESWKLDDVFRFVRSVGYEGVELAPFTLADDVREIGSSERERIREEAARAEVEIVGLHWLLVKPAGPHIAPADDEERRIRTRDYLLALVDFCADLGGEICVFGSPKQRGVPPGVSRKDHMELVAGTFKQVMPRAEEKGVVIAFEPLAPDENDFASTKDEAVELVRKVNSPSFKLHLDMKAMCSEEHSPSEIVRESKGLLAHFHANDENRRGPGMGETDFRPVAAALKEIGYDGWVSVEAFDFSPGAEETARRSLEYLKEVFS